MRLVTVKIMLFFAVLMFLAKPFIGFCVTNHFPLRNYKHNILLKAFTKRKQEFVEGSNFDIVGVQKSLTNPPSGLFVLFSSLLCLLFPALFCTGKVTDSILANMRLGLIPARQRYLLSGKLTI